MNRQKSALVNRRKTIILGICLVLALGCGIGGSASPTEEGEALTIATTPTRTPWPTFTPTQPIDVASLIPTSTSTFTPLPPTETPPPEPTATETPPPQPTDTPPPAAPEAEIVNTVNVRTGPSTAYNRIGQVDPGYRSEVFGRNSAADWILINYSEGQGWIAARFAQVAGDVNSLAVVQVDPPPPPPAAPAPAPQQPAPAPAPAPAEPAGPSYPYKLTNVFGEVNGGITQIRGYIKDSAGNAANGVRVRVRIGDFCTVSVASGTQGVYPAGNYDVLLRPYASDGVWQVSVVDSPTAPDDFSCHPDTQQLSEEVRVTTNTVEGVTYVEFQAQ